MDKASPFMGEWIEISELPNFETFRNLGSTALHLLATLPDEQKQKLADLLKSLTKPQIWVRSQIRQRCLI